MLARVRADLLAAPTDPDGHLEVARLDRFTRIFLADLHVYFRETVAGVELGCLWIGASP